MIDSLPEVMETELALIDPPTLDLLRPHTGNVIESIALALQLSAFDQLRAVAAMETVQSQASMYMFDVPERYLLPATRLYSYLAGDFKLWESLAAWSDRAIEHLFKDFADRLSYWIR